MHSYKVRFTLFSQNHFKPFIKFTFINQLIFFTKQNRKATPYKPSVGTYSRINQTTRFTNACIRASAPTPVTFAEKPSQRVATCVSTSGATPRRDPTSAASAIRAITDFVSWGTTARKSTWSSSRAGSAEASASSSGSVLLTIRTCLRTSISCLKRGSREY